jgi:hypothetical protein
MSQIDGPSGVRLVTLSYETSWMGCTSTCVGVCCQEMLQFLPIGKGRFACTELNNLSEECLEEAGRPCASLWDNRVDRGRHSVLNVHVPHESLIDADSALSTQRPSEISVIPEGANFNLPSRCVHSIDLLELVRRLCWLYLIYPSWHVHGRFHIVSSQRLDRLAYINSRMSMVSVHKGTLLLLRARSDSVLLPCVQLCLKFIG